MKTRFPFLACALLAACTGGNAADAGTPDTGFTLDPTWSALQEHVFTPSCTFSTCHGSAQVRSKLDLRPDASWAALVNAPARTPFRCADGGYAEGLDGGLVRVVPGDVDASILWEKVNDTAAHLEEVCHGNPMPDTDQRLPGWALDAIRGWISRGAPRD